MAIKNINGYLALSLFSIVSFSSPTYATEYIFRDVIGNTLAPTRCSTKSAASEDASDAYNINKFSKKFCEVQGYGWHVSEEKSSGKLVCDECSDSAGQGKYQCHMEDVVVTCKRIKPGSVGLIPGQS